MCFLPRSQPFEQKSDRVFTVRATVFFKKSTRYPLNFPHANTPGNRRVRWLVLSLVLLGVIIRLLFLGSMPDGVNQDEAMAAYESYSLLRTGVDLSGYHNPVYLEAWGDGMNALETYLMMPMIRLFGLELFAIRLPQAILGCLCLPVFYLLLRRLFGEPTALAGLFLLAINPWHIMLSRWALESNLAPALLLFGLYFFVLGLQKHPANFLFSAVFYGLCHYAYAVAWLIVPLLVGLSLLYALLQKATRFSGWLVGFLLLLALFALPLILLILVNQGFLSEIQTGWLSIPKMYGWRGGEFSLHNLVQPEAYLRLGRLLLFQSDGAMRNGFYGFGLFYLFSAPIILYGLFTSLQNTVHAFRAHRFSPDLLVLIWLFAATVLALLLTDINVNRINAIYLPLMICCAIGLVRLIRLPLKSLGRLVLAVYCAAFLSFSFCYFGAGQQELARDYQPEIRSALSYAESLTDGTIVWRNPARYTKILFYTKLDPLIYQATAEYDSADDPTPVAFDRYVIEPPETAELGARLYIIHTADAYRYLDAGYAIKAFQTCSVVWLPGTLSGG